MPYSQRPHQIYPVADLFALVSKREGFGSTIIEAASCGVPSLERIFQV